MEGVCCVFLNMCLFKGGYFLYSGFFFYCKMYLTKGEEIIREFGERKGDFNLRFCEKLSVSDIFVGLFDY